MSHRFRFFLLILFCLFLSFGALAEVVQVSGAAGAPAPTGLALSALTSGTAVNTIDSTLFAQSWKWGTLTTQTALSLSTSALTTGTTLLVTGAGASNTGYAGFFTNTATTGWALYANGAMGISGNLTFASTVLSAVQGNGSKIQLGLGSVTSGHASIFDVNGNLVDSGGVPATIPTGTAGRIVQYTSTSAVGASSLSLSTSNTKQINFLDNVTTGGLIGIPDTGLDTTSIAVGGGSLIVQTTTGNNNSAFGALSLTALTTGIDDTAAGNSAGAKVTAGSHNTLLGALVASTTLTTGNYDVLIGVDASTDTPLSNTTSAIGIGFGCRPGSTDVCVGSDALSSTSTNGNNNTAIGYHANSKNTSGNENTVVGSLAAAGIFGAGITTGVNNVIMGYEADTSGVGSSSAIAIGAFTIAGSSSVSLGTGINQNVTASAGTSSVQVGTDAGRSQTGGSQVFIGDDAGFAVSSGSNNTIIGFQTGHTTLTIGQDNIMVGVNSAIDATTSSESNSIHVGGTGGDWVHVTGTNAIATESTTLRGGLTVPDVTTGTNADFACFAAGGVITLQSTACTISSRRYKENILPLSETALDELMQLNPVQFNKKEMNSTPNKDRNFGKTELGFIAEDIADLDPRLAIYEDDLTTPKSYRQEGIQSLIVKSVQIQQKEIESIPALQADPCHSFNWLGRYLFCH